MASVVVCSIVQGVRSRNTGDEIDIEAQVGRISWHQKQANTLDSISKFYFNDTARFSLEMDHIDIANKQSLEKFITNYLQASQSWRFWTHPTTQDIYRVTLSTATGLSSIDFESCFGLIESTSSADYKNSRNGWKPKAKKKEMRLLDLKYFLVKHNDKVEGFLSFMPTYEDDYPVVYCYEIHLSPTLQG